MRLMQKDGGWSHLVMPIWLSVWLLAVPLFHVHPEGDHLHGTAGHVHGGTVHTVFSLDLDGEYDNHHHTIDGFGHSTPIPDALSDHPSHAVGFAELGFTFLNDSTEQKLPKPIVSLLLVVESIAIIASASTPSIVQRSESPPCQTFFTRDIPTRAPPSLFV
jgi:hypothetical protein